MSPNITIPEQDDTIFIQKKESVLKMLKRKFSFASEEVVITRMPFNCLVKIWGCGLGNTQTFSTVNNACYYIPSQNGWEAEVWKMISFSTDLAGNPQVFVELETFGIPREEAQARAEQLSRICDVEWAAWAGFILKATPDDRRMIGFLLKELQKLEPIKSPELKVKLGSLGGFIPKRE